MDELLEKNQIKLTIKEGRNFENVLYPTIITASLNNHSLKTELVPPSSNPQYLSELLWEETKKELRNMRSGQTPLKIECFALNEEGNRDKIGYILLSIRSAQIMLKHENFEVRYNWHSLLGLKGDLRASKPQLLLSLTITDFSRITNMKKINQNNSCFETITPVLLDHERLIQLGSIDSCHDLFLITIMAGVVNNVNVLINESVLNDKLDDVSFLYHIMDNDIKLDTFNKSYEKQWILNQKVFIRVRSSLAVLRNYFQIQPYLLIFLKFKDNKIAQSKLDIRPLIFTDCINEFVKRTQNSSTSLEQLCILLKEGESFNAHETKASISIKIKIQYLDKKYEDSQFQKIIPQTLPKSYSNNNEQTFKNNSSERMTNSENYRNYVEDYETPVQREFPEFQTMHNQLSTQNLFRATEELNFISDCPTNINSFHCYCLNIHLTGIKLLPSCPLIRNFEFRFHHPKAEIMSTLHPMIPVMSGGKVPLQNISCKLHFISSGDEIKNLLLSFPPKVSVYDENTNIFIAQTLLDVHKLFHYHKPECQYEALLVDPDGTQVGTLDVIMILEDHGPYYNDKNRNSGDNLGPPILDDSLMYKIVDELETWKEKQKELFRIELKNKEEQYLHILSEEWKKKKEALEAKLNNSVEQCKMLANSLNNATEDLRIRRLKSHEKETRLIKINEDLHKRYETKIQELRLSCEKMQNEYTVNMNVYKTNYESQIDNLKGENDKLQQKINSQSEQLAEYEKESLSPEQITSLLQEVKNLKEQLLKSEENTYYYKEQWSNIHSEMERIKTEYQQVLRMQIKKKREEFKEIDCEDILSAHSEALESDQAFLKKLNKKIEGMEPRYTHIMADSNCVSIPLNSLVSNHIQSPRKSKIFVRDENREAKINKLIEEKNSLLKTGSYLKNDAIIVKLDDEIRSLHLVTD